MLKSKLKVLGRKLLWQIDVPIVLDRELTLHVDLGAGNVPRNPFSAKNVIATDFHASFISKDGYTFVKSDLTQKLPFESDSVSAVSAFDVLEHIPRWERTSTGIEFPFISLMNEIYRVLKPGGVFLAVMPVFPNEEAFKDPTHVNIMSKSTIQYFALPEPWAKLLGYGFLHGFEVVTQCWLRGTGPYESKSIVGYWDRLSLPEKLRSCWLLASRIIRLKKRKANCPLLWVLRKPTNL